MLTLVAMELQHLQLHCVGAGDTIDELGLSGNDAGDRGASMLASVLSESKNIACLNAGSNDTGPEGATAIAAALRASSSLKELILSNNPIEGDGAIQLAEALTVNATLEKIDVSSFGSKGMEGLIAKLPQMSALRGLAFGCLDECAAGMCGSFLQAVEQSTSLECCCLPHALLSIQTQVERIMSLSRAGWQASPRLVNWCSSLALASH